MNLSRPGGLIHNTLWMILGQGVRILVQTVYFILIARILDSDGYGAFAGVVAVVAILAPFAGWGGGSLLIQNVARDNSLFAVYWGRALGILGLSSILLIVTAVILAWCILPSTIELSIVLCVAISDLFFIRIVELSGQAFQAFQKLFKTALTSILIAVSRLCAVLILLYINGSAKLLLIWALLYLAGSLVVACITFLWVIGELGWPRWHLSDWHRGFGEGLFFSIGTSAQRIYTDSDKALLTRLSTLETAGIYSAAFRLADVCFIPVSALLNAAYPRFFMHGSQGLQSSVGLAKRLMPPALVYAVIAAVGIYFIAPFLPLLLGGQYAESVKAARWLAILPFLMTLRYLAANSLTGAGQQALRSVCEVAIAIFNVILNLILIPKLGWMGAAISVIASEVLLSILLWGLIGINLRHYRNINAQI